MMQNIGILAALLLLVSGSVDAKGLDTILSKATFQKLFPNALPIYQYENMVAMSQKYPTFANTGNNDVDKREVAAFLGQISLESGDLQYVEEINKSDYCQASANYPCASGKQYYGRGPIQLSWNYNYKDFGDAFGKDVVSNPDLIAQDKDLVWLSAFWFWNADKWNGNIHDVVGQPGGFAYTTYIINGGLECGPNPPNKQSEVTRIASYNKYCDLLGVSPGDNLSCQTNAYPPTTPWPKTKAPKPSTAAPTDAPSEKPTKAPTQQPQPTSAPTSKPSPSPTTKPTIQPSVAPTFKPSGVVKKRWEQCGGKDYTGSTQCADGNSCFKQDEWYSQCIPAKNNNN